MKLEKITTANFCHASISSQFPGFLYLSPFLKLLHSSNHALPDLWHMNQVAQWHYQRRGLSAQDTVQFVQQTQQDYVQSIIESRQVPTRNQNLHDYFNNLTWIAWPKLKSFLYRAYVQADDPNHSKRSLFQNFVALFDECGIIVATTDHYLTDLIRQFKFKTLFYEQRARCENARVFVFGHGILEKALNPYIGLTGNALFVHVDKGFLQMNVLEQMNYLDTCLTARLKTDLPKDTKALQPLPILGWPGWFHTQNAAFYDNKAYFRTGRKHVQKLSE